MVQATGLPASVSGVVSYAASSVALSKNATRAVVTGFAQQAPNNSRSGVAYRSINGGLTYSPLVLPARTYVLNGAGFINNDEALILGDSSVILRMDASGNLTALTGAQGVPQATTDTATGTVTTYSFVKADFAPGSNVGFVIGRARRVSPSGPPVVTGVILISRDGGRTFTRQAIRGEPNNGQDFPITIDLQVLTPDFAALSGSNGLVAARTSDVQTGVQACSFTNANNP
jgi:hypothetical protein